MKAAFSLFCQHLLLVTVFSFLVEDASKSSIIFTFHGFGLRFSSIFMQTFAHLIFSFALFAEYTLYILFVILKQKLITKTYEHLFSH